MSRYSRVLVALPVVLLLSTPARAGRYVATTVSNGGTVRGTVQFRGSAARKRLKVTKDHGTCGRTKLSQQLVVSGGRLANAVVYLKGITRGKPGKKGLAVLDQRKCVYVPHVQAALKRSKLELRSSDGVLHNVNGSQNGRVLFNVAMPMKGQRIRRKLRKAGLIRVKCDAGHTWMRAYIWVFAHPYFAVTGRDGRFELADVPAGSYTLVVWHEKLGTRSARINVAAGGSITKTLRY